jgi:hypothetical protein
MVDLHGHEAGNGGYSQGTPTAHRHLSYSERCPASRVHSSMQHHLRTDLFKGGVYGPREAIGTFRNAEK